jgi:hypothetical protein
MALCFRNESAELTDRSVVESLLGEMGREREMSFTVIFPFCFLPMFFLDSNSKDSYVASTISFSYSSSPDVD